MDTATTIAVLSIVASILIGSLAYIIHVAQSQDRKVEEALRLVKERIDDAVRDRNRALEMCQSLHKIATCLAVDQRILRDLLEEIYESNSRRSEVVFLRQEWRKSDREIEAHQADIRVFSPATHERDSAFRTLAARLGDVDSLRKMRLAAVGDPNLESLCTQLESRLRREKTYK